jgi:hypothetical protein
MKHLFREGKFVEVDGVKRLEFLGNNEEANSKFKDSAFRMTNLVSLYDFEQLKGTEYYYIYKAYGFDDAKGFVGSKRQDPKEVAHSLKKILNGNNEDVINYEDLTLGCGYSEIENDIFWDVNNNIIFVKGEEALKNMCVELVMSGFERLGVKRTKESEELYLSNAIDIPMIVKLFNLDPEKFAEENIKKLKLLYN